MQSCSESSTDEAYDLATQWIKDIDSYPRGGPSNEEVSGVFQSDTALVAPFSVPTTVSGHINHSLDIIMVPPSTVPIAAPTRTHLSGYEEVVTNSMVSEEVGDTSASEEVTAPTGAHLSGSEEDTEPYNMTELLNLDSISLRRSSRTQ